MVADLITSLNKKYVILLLLKNLLLLIVWPRQRTENGFVNVDFEQKDLDDTVDEVDSAISVSKVGACHIVQVICSCLDAIWKSLALCPKLDCSLDHVLISVNENFRVLISNRFTESNSNYSIRIFEGKEINLPKERKYWPLQENFGWHRGRYNFKTT